MRISEIRGRRARVFWVACFLCLLQACSKPSQEVLLSVDGRSYLVHLGGIGSELEESYTGFRDVPEVIVSQSELLILSSSSSSAGVYRTDLGGRCSMRARTVLLVDGGMVRSIHLDGFFENGGRRVFFSSMIEPEDLNASHKLCGAILDRFDVR